MFGSVDVPTARMEVGPRRSASVRVHATIGVLLLLAAFPGAAQSVGVAELPRRAAASRVELDSLVLRAQAAAAGPSVPAEQSVALQRYASDLRVRLREGDFQPGDHIILAVHGDTTLSGTYVVQPSRTLVVAKLPPIPLTGVLRSELQPYVASRLRTYVRDTLFQGTPLVPVGVLGEVVHPGYYRVSLDATLGDALMAAGGPTARADVRRTTVRRGDTTVLPATTVRDAMARGLPLGALDVDAGDELIVVPPHERDWMLITQLVGVGTGLLFTLKTIRVF